MDSTTKQALREADSSYLNFVLDGGEADKETTAYINQVLQKRNQTTFFDGAKHIKM